MQTESSSVTNYSQSEKEKLKVEKSLKKEEHSCEPTESKSEYELIESRLDEQAQLIMILRNGIEESNAKYEDLLEENQGLAENREQFKKMLEDATNNSTKMIDRVKTIKSNYEELTYLLNNHKEMNAQLKIIRNDSLEEQNRLYLDAKTEANTEIARLTTYYTDVKKECNEVEKDIRRHKADSVKRKYECLDAIDKLKSSHRPEAQALMDNLQVKKSILEEKQAYLQKQESKLINDKMSTDTVLKLTSKNASLFSDEARFSHQLKTEEVNNNLLQESTDDLERKINELNKEFEKQVSEIKEREEIKELHKKINEAQDKLKRTKEDIKQFKEEFQKKLEEERELNRKLRHIN